MGGIANVAANASVPRFPVPNISFNVPKPSGPPGSGYSGGKPPAPPRPVATPAANAPPAYKDYAAAQNARIMAQYGLDVANYRQREQTAQVPRLRTGVAQAEAALKQAKDNLQKGEDSKTAADNGVQTAKAKLTEAQQKERAAQAAYQAYLKATRPKPK